MPEQHNPKAGDPASEKSTRRHSPGMARPVLTPITQAIQEGALTRSELKALMTRSDRHALGRLIIWCILLMATSWLISLSLGTIWLLPAMIVQGIVLVHHFSLQHECVHYTPFKTRWLNDWIGNLCGLIIMLPNRFFRYEHCDHHTFTQLDGRDPEMIPMPGTWVEYATYLSSIPYWKTKFSELTRHTFGKLNADEKRFVPVIERKTVILEARLMTVFYLCILVACISFQWWAPLWYWWLPVILGEPVMRAIRMTEHVGRPTTALMRENTRSNLVSWPMQFLSWNMNYHAEHHYAASVPFHALPKLHEKLNGYVHVEPRGYIGAHLDIIGQLSGKTPRPSGRTDHSVD